MWTSLERIRMPRFWKWVNQQKLIISCKNKLNVDRAIFSRSDNSLICWNEKAWLLLSKCLIRTIAKLPKIEINRKNNNTKYRIFVLLSGSFCKQVRTYWPFIWLGARSKFWGVSGSEDRGGGDNSIQVINSERVGDKNFKEWRQKIGGWKGGWQQYFDFLSHCTR